jgi:hypothetical protein
MLNKRWCGGATRKIHCHLGPDNAQIARSCPSTVTHILNNWFIKHLPNIHSFNRHNHIQSPLTCLARDQSSTSRLSSLKPSTSLHVRLGPLQRQLYGLYQVVLWVSSLGGSIVSLIPSVQVLRIDLSLKGLYMLLLVGT